MQLLPQEVQRIAALLSRCLAYLCVHTQPPVLAAFDRISTVIRSTAARMCVRPLRIHAASLLSRYDMSRIICLVSCPTRCDIYGENGDDNEDEDA